MKTNELKCPDLRIGNYLKYNNKIVEVFGLRPRYVEYYEEDEFLVGDNPEYFEPIELTEEVLLKIGFVKENEVHRMYNNRCVISYYIGNFYEELVIEVRRENGFYKNNMVHYDIKYLHELQNAYYCLTGQELEVEL